MRFSLALFLSFLFSISVFSQHTLRGKVVNKNTDEIVEMATVRLLHVNDSSLAHGVQSNLEGQFLIPDIKQNEYILKISSIGYTDYVQNVRVVSDSTLNNIYLSEDVQLLSELEVVGVATQMLVKGDTLEYNATTFKTAENAVVEELLGKMPGIEITSEGKIYVNGEEVKKIRIDGKKFFGGDLQMATKNIPAEMIEKVQVMDENSEMAKLTGMKDDDDTKIINLTLKPDRKKGYFGNHTGGAGIDLKKLGGLNNAKQEGRYDVNSFNNFMLGESQTSLVLGANNANNARSTKGRSNISSNNGITSTQNIGFNTNVEVNEKLKILGELTGNHSNNITNTQSNKQSYSAKKNFTNYDDRKSFTDNYDMAARAEIEFKTDSFRTFFFQPNFSYQYGLSDNTNNYDYFTDTTQTTQGHALTMRTNDRISGGLNFIYNQKLKKKGRAFTVRAGASMTETNSDALNQSERNILLSGKQNKIDQKVINTSFSHNYNLRVSYVEPIIVDKHFLEVAANLQYSNRTSEKAQYKFDTLQTNDYSIFDAAYSNRYQNYFFNERMELNYRIRDPKYDMMFGFRANPSQTFSTTIYGDNTADSITNKVWNYTPIAYIRYKFNKRKFIRFDYRGLTKPPSIWQLEPSKNNSNPMLEVVGNSDLQPAFIQNFKVLYNQFNSKRFSSFSIGIQGQMVKDALVQNTIFDETGKQYRQTINSEIMPYSLNGSLMYNTPIIKKRLHFNTHTSVNYNRLIGYTLKDLPESEGDSLFQINQLPLGHLSTNRNLRIKENLSITFTHDVLELGLNANASYSITDNNLNDKESETFDWNTRGHLLLKLPWKMSIGTNVAYLTRYGYDMDDNDELIWNFSIDQTCFKRRGVFTLSVFDILNQKKNVKQVIGDNFIRYDTYNTLPTYAMLTFAYRPTKIGKKRK